MGWATVNRSEAAVTTATDTAKTGAIYSKGEEAEDADAYIDVNHYPLFHIDPYLFTHVRLEKGLLGWVKITPNILG